MRESIEIQGNISQLQYFKWKPILLYCMLLSYGILVQLLFYVTSDNICFGILTKYNSR